MSWFRLSASSLIFASVALSACSKSQELRTPAQSAAFITAVARHGNADAWQLSSNASDQATRVWAEHGAIEAVGRQLRTEGQAWACELAEGAITQRSDGVFTVGDRESMTETAQLLHARRSQIEALLAQVQKLTVADLTSVRSLFCR